MDYSFASSREDDKTGKGFRSHDKKCVNKTCRDQDKKKAIRAVLKDRPFSLTLRSGASIAGSQALNDAQLAATLHACLRAMSPSWRLLGAACWKGSIYIHLDMLYMPDLQTQDEDMEPNRPAQEHAGVAAAEVAMQGQAVPSDQTAAQRPVTAAYGTAQALNVSRPQSQSQAYEELENFVSSLSASRLFPDMEAQDEADSFNVVRAGSQPSHGAALSQVHFNILTPLVLLWQSGRGVQVAVDLSCSQTMLDKMRIILRHCGPASVFSVQPTVVYSPVELCKQNTAASVSTSAQFTPSQLPPVATFQGLLPCNLGQDAGPGLLWVELWHNTTCMSAQPLLLLQQTDADWASELAVYLGRLEEETANVMQADDTEASSMAAAHTAGLAAGQPQQGSVHNARSLIQQLQRYQQGQHNRPALSHEHEQGPGSRNSNQSSGAHSNRSGVLVPLLSNGPKQASQQLIQDLGRWLAYARACSQHNQSCASQQQQQSLPVDLMSASDRDRSSAQAGTTAGSPSVAASAAIEPALPPWAGVRTSSLKRFMVESALALLLEATEAGCALSADALMRSFMEAGMSVHEVVAATWQPAAGSQDLPLLHAAVMSCSPQMVDLAVAWLQQSGVAWSWTQQLPILAALDLLPPGIRSASALQLTAAQEDGGALAAHVLLRYECTRFAWAQVPVIRQRDPAMPLRPAGQAHGQSVQQQQRQGPEQQAQGVQALRRPDSEWNGTTGALAGPAPAVDLDTASCAAADQAGAQPHAADEPDAYCTQTPAELAHRLGYDWLGGLLSQLQALPSTTAAPMHGSHAVPLGAQTMLPAGQMLTHPMQATSVLVHGAPPMQTAHATASFPAGYAQYPAGSAPLTHRSSSVPFNNPGPAWAPLGHVPMMAGTPASLPIMQPAINGTLLHGAGPMGQALGMHPAQTHPMPSQRVQTAAVSSLTAGYASDEEILDYSPSMHMLGPQLDAASSPSDGSSTLASQGCMLGRFVDMVAPAPSFPRALSQASWGSYVSSCRSVRMDGNDVPSMAASASIPPSAVLTPSAAGVAWQGEARTSAGMHACSWQPQFDVCVSALSGSSVPTATPAVAYHMQQDAPQMTRTAEDDAQGSGSSSGSGLPLAASHVTDCEQGPVPTASIETMQMSACPMQLQQQQQCETSTTSHPVSATSVATVEEASPGLEATSFWTPPVGLDCCLAASTSEVSVLPVTSVAQAVPDCQEKLPAQDSCCGANTNAITNGTSATLLPGRFLRDMAGAASAGSAHAAGPAYAMDSPPKPTTVLQHVNAKRDVRIKHAPRYHVEMMACCCAWLLLTISTSSHTSTPDPTAQSNATACGAPPNAYNYASSSVGGQCPMLGRVGMANGFPTHLSSLSHSSTFLAHFLESSRAPWVTYGISSWKPVLSLLSFTYATLLAVNAVAYMSSAAMRPVLAAQLWPLLWTLRMGAKLLALVHACMRLAYGTASATAALPTTELVAAVCFGALADGLAPQAALTAQWGGGGMNAWFLEVLVCWALHIVTALDSQLPFIIGALHAAAYMGISGLVHFTLWHPLKAGRVSLV